jgi:mRNA-degrading endonuclease YafQ of YafQ-DinJ toxin-antitoxin module
VTFQLVTTSNFDRRLARIRRVHPQLRLARVFVDLETDPFQPHLRLHPLKGELAGLHAVSVTYAYYLTLILCVTENEIVLLDIGSHDEVYR